MNKSLEGKIALVTGGSSGIGRASALTLAEEGAKVCLMDIKEDSAEKVREDIERLGGEAFVVDADLSDPKRVQHGIEEVKNRWGSLDIVFANGGINGVLAPIEDMSPEDWDKTINTNLKGTFHTVKYAIPLMKSNGGSIIITSSVNGNRVFSNLGMSAYSTSKAGQMAFGKMAALELAQYKIRVNIICPGAIETNIGKNTEKTPELEKIDIPVEYPEGDKPLEDGPGKPEQVAKLIRFLASDESSHISGTEMFIDGAESLL
ncbi:NAD(P)-dependent dehydrogenase, short-chain alcohol dehydrogenase family [Gracilibacillus ureilyticus]|uniref:NAD(P)-dependent dehydrogenase, short-chain alcohol dehydrogenase family n=1 Tax=Gracilibacillus ureilyticus TaxID=531814 RepID=A0A1H9R8X5_9BACI|nr:SDR family NAD(P)-dependent oxidoreductase [Gracilibacillus ureilyticus]SER68393.1 NAD(P)-dependent dehydrogenase, short-chain alcohol dehydrogenase family [Gracilibacillus ureilyticus]